jgi:hypothetical protein
MDQLIFILGMPRSGTTLLQRILSTSSEVATAPEPWLLLPFLNFRESRNVKSIYGSKQAALGFREFLGKDNSFEQDLAGCLRKYFKNRYGTVRYFCEKTPRNILYADCLRQWFPHDRYIILNRNPISVAVSIFRIFESGVLNPYKFNLDLGLGLRQLVALNRDPSGALVLRYEDPVKKPGNTLTRCSDFLGLEKPLNIDGPLPRSEGQMSDPTGQFSMSRIHAPEETAYLSFIDSSYRKWWFLSLLKQIGPVDFNTLGYDYKAHFHAIQRHGVKKLISLKDLGFLIGRKILEFATFRMFPRRPEERPDFILY